MTVWGNPTRSVFYTFRYLYDHSPTSQYSTDEIYIPTVLLPKLVTMISRQSFIINGMQRECKQDGCRHIENCRDGKVWRFRELVDNRHMGRCGCRIQGSGSRDTNVPTKPVLHIVQK